MKITVTKSLTCPRCGAQEVENQTVPVREWQFNIRAYRVEQGGVWWSQCLNCKAAGHKDEGWFK